MRRMNVAIIGAGIAGCTLANALPDRYRVTVFEKSRGAGGRMATRYVESGGVHLEFDHGTPNFAARGAAFRAFMDDAVIAGAAARSTPHGNAPGDTARSRFTGLPRMNSICRWLLLDMDVRTNTRITRLRYDGRRWMLDDTEGRVHGPFDVVALTAPAPQTADLAPPGSRIASRARKSRMEPRLTLMLGFSSRTPVPIVPREPVAPLDRVIVNSAKPGRPTAGAIVAHASSPWSIRHVDADPVILQQQLTDAFAATTGVDAGDACYARLHRWRYARCSGVATEYDALFELDAETGLAACGDWLADGRVEGAWTSARALARALPARERGY